MPREYRYVSADSHLDLLPTVAKYQVAFNNELRKAIYKIRVASVITFQPLS